MISVFCDYWLYRLVLHLGKAHEQYVADLKYLIKNINLYKFEYHGLLVIDNIPVVLM